MFAKRSARNRAGGPEESGAQFFESCWCLLILAYNDPAVNGIYEPRFACWDNKEYDCRGRHFFFLFPIHPVSFTFGIALRKMNDKKVSAFYWYKTKPAVYHDIAREISPVLAAREKKGDEGLAFLRANIKHQWSSNGNFRGTKKALIED